MLKATITHVETRYAYVAVGETERGIGNTINTNGT